MGENSCFGQNGINGSYWGIQLTLLDSFSKFFIRFFRNFTWWQNLEVGKSNDFWYIKKILSVSKMKKKPHFGYNLAVSDIYKKCLFGWK